MKSKLLVSLSASIALVAPLVLATPASASTIDASFGYDVSWPQCGRVLPTDGAFKIVGINGGRPFDENPCLLDQLLWAKETSPQLYFNTANPGPELSMFWPIGQTSPKTCSELAPDSMGCAFNYGYNFAEYAYISAETSYENLGLATSPKDAFIWLDVELENSWRLESPKKNVKALQGAVYYLKNVAKVKRLGFYSNDYQWGVITGSTKVFDDYPSWVATASNRELSIEACAKKVGFTGGRTRLTQYIDLELDLDVNVNCLNAPQLATSFTELIPASVPRGQEAKVSGTLVSETGNPVVRQEIVIRVFGDRYKVKTNRNGVFRALVEVPRKRGEYQLSVRFRGADYFASTAATAALLVE
jgi:hypothetical protein